MSARKDIYQRYNQILRPLVSEIEGRNEAFEQPLLTDVASIFDALALSDGDSKKEDEYIQLASDFLDMSISHSYQYLIKNLDIKMKEFENRCNASDRNILDEGRFIGKYISLRQKAIRLVRQGRNEDDKNGLRYYAEAYDAYIGIEKLIDRELPVQIMQNTRKLSNLWTVIGWVCSIIISIIFGKLAIVWAVKIAGVL